MYAIKLIDYVKIQLIGNVCVIVFYVRLGACLPCTVRKRGRTLKVPNHFVLPIANPFLLCPDV